jgi:hypothetical protein
MTTSTKVGVDEPSSPCTRAAEHVEPQIGREIAVAAAAKPWASWWASKWAKVAVAAAITLITLMAAATITVGVLCSQVSGEEKPIQQPWNNTITVNVYVEGDDTIDTSEIVKRSKSEQDDSLTIEEFRALLESQDFLTQSIDRIVGLSDELIETRLKLLEAELQASVEAQLAKLREIEANDANYVQLDGHNPTNVTFPIRGYSEPESETSEGTNSGKLRKLSAISGPSADAPALGIKAQTTPEFQKVVAAARAGDRRALNVFNYPCKTRMVQSCKRVPYVSCSWRGCRRKWRNVCWSRPAGLQCESTGRLGEAAKCEVEASFPFKNMPGACAVKIESELKILRHGTDVRVGFVIYPGQAHASNMYLEIRVMYEMSFSLEAYCEGAVEAVYELESQPYPVATGVQMQGIAGIKAAFKAGISGKLTHTLPGEIYHKLFQEPALRLGRASTKFEKGAKVAVDLEATLSIKTFAPEVAELVTSFGFRVGSETGVKICQGGRGGLYPGHGGNNFKAEIFMTIAFKAPAGNFPTWSFGCSVARAFKLNALDNFLTGMNQKFAKAWQQHDWAAIVGFGWHPC